MPVKARKGTGSRTTKARGKGGRGASRSSTSFKLLLLAGLLVGFLLLFPIIEVAAVRFIDPPFTPLMIGRRIESWWTGASSTRTEYESLPLKKVPTYFLAALLVSEDQRFFDHRGFDWKEIHAAREKARRTNRPVRGASTITMQCARSLFLWQGRSWIRKGLEAYYTVLMEALLSKKRILELYANVIEMGDGVYGIEAAARHHYRVHARELSLEQSAMLAAMLPNPRRWDPLKPSPRLQNRQQRILRQTHEAQILAKRLKQ